MRYKALIMDVDGTCVPHAIDGLPSKKVLTAIRAAQKKVPVCACTSRPIFIAKDVIRALGLKHPCGVNDGTQIYDPLKKKIVRTFSLSKDAAAAVQQFYESHRLKYMVNVGETEEFYDGGELPEDVCSLCVPELPTNQAMIIKDELVMTIPNIAVQTPPSYTAGNVWISATSPIATKLHSVIEIARMLEVDPKDIIGIGDGYNDFPLLEACGLKIAMGNAVPELKAIADFVAPTVDEDGVATVIEKFILA